MNMRTAMIHPYRNDLKGMSLAQINGNLREAQDKIDTEESWVEALTAWREVLTTNWYMTGQSQTTDGTLALSRAEANAPAIARLMSGGTEWAVVSLARAPVSGPNQPPFRIVPTDYMALTAKPVEDAQPVAHQDAASNDTGFDNGRDHPKRYAPVGIRGEKGVVINANVEPGEILYVSTDTPLEAIVTVGEPRGFADWKTRLTELRAELVNLTTILVTGLDPAIAIVDELLEGFDDVVETRDILAWNDEPAAPKDGTMLRLLVKPDAEAHTSFQDSDEPYETIGFNQLSDTGDDEWQFAGWDWSFDCITQGHGEVIGWRPFALETSTTLAVQP